jgi:hypothetical protein
LFTVFERKFPMGAFCVYQRLREKGEYIL